MYKQTRLLVIVAIIVALLGIAAALLMLNPVTEEENGTVFKDFAPVDVKEVRLDNAYGTFDIAFTGEGYMVDDIPAELVDMKEFFDLLTYSGSVSALSTVVSAPDELGIYGLAEPAATVEVTYADKSKLTLLIGDAERVTGNYYCSVAGDPAVYLMESVRCAGFLLPKKAYVEDLVTPVLALSSPLSALLDVTFTGGPLTEPITVKAVAGKEPEVTLAALSFGAATHIVQGHGVYELDQTYALEVMGGLLGIPSYDIVGYNLTPPEIMAFGFDRPTMQVEFDLKNGIDADVVHYRLALLQKGDAFYMTCNENGVIYAVSEPPFLHIKYSKLLVRWFLSPLMLDVSELRLETEGKTYHFIITGESNADKQVTCNGEALDIERFRALYKLLTSAAHDGTLLEDAQVNGEPLLTLTYTYLNKQKQPDVLKLYPGDARRLYVNINGVTEVAMREMFLTRVQQALRIFSTEEPITTDW